MSTTHRHEQPALPEPGVIVGYARVSTREQSTSLDEQRERLHQLGAVRVFEDVASGARADRPGLAAARDFGLITKSNLILGMGETIEEVHTALRDLHDAGCDIVTITQYLRPSPRHHPVERWVHPDEFVELSSYAEGLGFAGVLAGPLVRSSYRAGRLYAQAARVRFADRPPVS